MLLSVLLPTHERLEYLRYAVESVRRQDHGAWEIVISDNASTQDVSGYVAGLGDERIRYVATPSFVPVTENWNNALRHCRGDYVVMLGDDDALLPGYGRAVTELAERFDRPEVIYTGARLIAYPGAVPDQPAGYVEPYSYAPFFAGRAEPFVLDPAQALGLARDAMAFRVAYGFNMQFAAISTAAIERLAGTDDFFASPFPDYYAMNLLFARARSIVVDPAERVAIGITTRSYGHFHSTGREEQAIALLNNDSTDPEIRRDLAAVLMPGTNINTGWLLAMEALSRKLGRPPDLRPDYRRYHRLQAVFCYQHHYFDGVVSAEDMAAVRAKLTRRERSVLLLTGWLGGRLARMLPSRARAIAGRWLDRVMGQFRSDWQPQRTVGRYATVLELYDALETAPGRADEPVADPRA